MAKIELGIRGVKASDYDEIPPFTVYFNDVEKPSTSIHENYDQFLYEYEVNEPIKIKLEIKPEYPLAIESDREYSIAVYDYSTGNSNIYYFTVSEDNLTIESDDKIPDFSGFEYLRLFLYERAIEKIENYPFINIYKMSETELNTLTKKDIYSKTDTNFQARGLDNYIVRINRIPYTIESGKKTPIKFGKTSIDMEVPQVLKNEQKIDLGKIKIPNRQHKQIGYKNISVILYVPYFEPIKLESQYYLNSEIQLFLTIDLLSGQGTLNLYNSKLDSESDEKPSITGDEWVGYVSTSSIGDSIPFEIGERLNIATDSGKIETDFKTPYVEVKTLVPDNEVDYRKNELIEIDKTRDYMKTNKVFISGKLSIDEQKEIRSLVSNGILINK